MRPLAGEDDPVVETAAVLERTGDFADFLGESFDEAEATDSSCNFRQAQRD